MLIMIMHLIHKKIKSFLLKSIICHYAFWRSAFKCFQTHLFLRCASWHLLYCLFLDLQEGKFFSQVFLSFGQSITELLYSSLVKDSKQYYFQQNFASAFTDGQSCSEILSVIKIKILFHQPLVKMKYEWQHGTFHNRAFLKAQPKIVHGTSHRKQRASQTDLPLSALSRKKKEKTQKPPFDLLNLPSVTLTHIYEYKHYIYCRWMCIYDT